MKTKTCVECCYFEEKVSYCERFECDTREQSIACNGFKPLEDKEAKMSKTCKDCLHCSVDDDEVLCSGMPWHYPFGGSDTVTLDKEACEYFLERDKPTVFDKITESVETLAEEFVDTLYDRVACEYRYYSMLTGDFYNSRAEAIVATIEELKKETKDE